MWRLILLAFVALFGLWVGKSKEPPPPLSIEAEGEFPLREHKSFVIVVYAHNQSHWCKRALSSIFEQNYDHYRVIVIDDASLDQTEETAKNFILENNQDEKVIFIRNETYLGPVASLYRVIDNCLDREIVIPLDAQDWFTTSHVLTRLNAVYQNPDVWMLASWSIEYPTYQISEEDGPVCYYAALFKEIKLRDLFSKGRFTKNPLSYLKILRKLAGERARKLSEPLGFKNIAPSKHPKEKIRPVSYDPLASFPKGRKEKSVEIMILSEDHPLELYSCLESIQRYVQGFKKMTVFYRASNPSFEGAYHQLKNAFPAVFFCSWQDPKKIDADYVLLGLDHKNVKDFVDLKVCVEQIEKTGASGFYLLDAEAPQGQPLSSGVYAWEMQREEGEWARPQHFFAIYPKKIVEQALSKSKSPKNITCELPKSSIGLYRF